MAKTIMRCLVCHRYTMQKLCCDKSTEEAKPPKYSPEDKYGSYRRQVKEEDRKQKQLL